MIIALGCDHAGFPVASRLKGLLEKAGHVVKDLGTDSQASVDYPEYAFKVGEAVASRDADRGILVCGTGIGMCIAANKVSGVFAALVHDVHTAGLAARHNGANVLCLGGRVHAPEMAWEIVRTWLETPFEERHRRRVNMITTYEQRKG